MRVERKAIFHARITSGFCMIRLYSFLKISLRSGLRLALLGFLLGCVHSNKEVDHVEKMLTGSYKTPYKGLTVADQGTSLPYSNLPNNGEGSYE